MKSRILNFFSNPGKVVKFNAALLMIGVILNFWLQVFCIPVNWAIVMLTICFLNSIFFPILVQRKKLLPIVSFLSGVSFCLFLYCIIFLGRMNFIGLFLLILGIGIFTFIPHYFAIQLFWKGFLKQSAKQGKWFFIMGIAVSLVLPIVSTMKFQEAIVDIDNFKKSNFTALEKTYLTEKILGIGLIYHTEFNEYDGWRPPIHDPFLNMGLWLNGNPLRLNLKYRYDLYQKFFPNRKVKLDCSCAYQYSDWYHNDKLWK